MSECQCGENCQCQITGKPCDCGKNILDIGEDTLRLSPATEYMTPIYERPNNKNYGFLSKRNLRSLS